MNDERCPRKLVTPHQLCCNFDATKSLISVSKSWKSRDFLFDPRLKKYCWDSVIQPVVRSKMNKCAYNMVFSVQFIVLHACQPLRCIFLQQKIDVILWPIIFVVWSFFFKCLQRTSAISDCHKNAHQCYTELHRNKL